MADGEVLIVGCGPHRVRGKNEIHLDVRDFGNVDVVHDLNEFPWPFKDNSMVKIEATHVVEHLYCLLIPFMDEAWRILKPGGSLYLETPLATADPDMDWADPTHIRCYRKHSFINYLSLEGTKQFRYTNRAWNFFVLCEREPDHSLIVHAYPLKK